MKTVIAFFSLLFLVIPVTTVCAGQTDLDELLRRSLAAYSRVTDYRCIFHKKELIKGEVKETRNMEFKFRKPASYYLKYTEGMQSGLESIYVAGKYDNKLEVHLGRLFGFYRTTVEPRGSQALKHNRHPITEAGIGQLLRVMESNYRKSKNDPGSHITLEADTFLNGRKVHLIKAVFPKDKGYYAGKVLLYIDANLCLPTKITAYGWSNEFLEEYQYDGVRLNAGLTDKDFDVNNPEYHF